MILKPAHLWKDTNEVGFFAGVSNADYQNSPGVSASYLKRLAVSPAHTKLPFEPSAQLQKSLDLGTLVHGVFLENKSPQESGFARKPDGLNFATKEGKAWRLENPGPIIDGEQAEAVEIICASLAQDAAFVARDAHAEISARVIDPETGLMLRARFDGINEATIYDIKTCQDADPDAFAKDCEDRFYFLQAAHYMHAAKLLGIEVNAFVFVAVSTNAPYEVSINDFGRDHPAWEAVNHHLHDLFALHAECEATQAHPRRFWRTQARVKAWSRYATRRAS